MKEQIIKQLNDSAELKLKVKEKLTDNILAAAELMIETYKNKGKVIFAGNGGSAADAQHLTAEFIGKFGMERKALPALALTTNSSILTALANDYGYQDIFIRQLEAQSNSGDVFVLISTSGNSENIIRALDKAREMKLKTIAFLGCSGGKLADKADISLIVPSDNTARIQEAHITMGHIICGLVEKKIFNN